MVADGYVPNSSEFRLTNEGTTWAAQRAEHLGTGRVRVYHAVVGNWTTARSVERGAGSVEVGGETYTSRQYNYAFNHPATWRRAVSPAAPARGLTMETVTLEQPGYGTPGKFTSIDISVNRGTWPATGLGCTIPNTTVAGVRGCHMYQAAAQNTAQEAVVFQRGDLYTMIVIHYMKGVHKWGR